MSQTPTHDEKLAFVDAFLAIAVTHAPEIAPFRVVFEQVCAKPTKRNVDSLYHDLIEWCRCCPREIRAEVSTLLRTKIGRPLNYFEKKRLARIDKIVSRGRIQSDDEWRLIDERIQELCEVGDPPSDCAALDRMQRDYEAKKKAKRARVAER